MHGKINLVSYVLGSFPRQIRVCCNNHLRAPVSFYYILNNMPISSQYNIDQI